MRYEATPASGLVFVTGPDLDAGFGFDRALRVVRRGAAFYADGVCFGDELRHAEQLGHRFERPAGVILVQPRNYHALSLSGELVNRIDESHIEKLALIDPDHFSIGFDRFEHLDRRGHRHRIVLMAGVRRDLLNGISCIDSGFEHLNLLAGDAGPVQAADQFFRLSGEHRTDNHLDPSGAVLAGLTAFLGVVEREFFDHNWAGEKAIIRV